MDPLDEPSRLRELARVARLALDDAEVEALAPELEALVALFDELATVDVDGVPPLTHPLAGSCPLRDDRPREGRARAEGASATRLQRLATPGRGAAPRDFGVLPTGAKR